MKIITNYAITYIIWLLCHDSNNRACQLTACHQTWSHQVYAKRICIVVKKITGDKDISFENLLYYSIKYIWYMKSNIYWEHYHNLQVGAE